MLWLVVTVAASVNLTEPSFRYIDADERGWVRFVDAVENRRSSNREVRLCLASGDHVDLSGEVTTTNAEVCGGVTYGDPYRVERACFDKAEVVKLGLPSRRLVVGTPAGPRPCPQ